MLMDAFFIARVFVKHRLFFRVHVIFANFASGIMAKLTARLCLGGLTVLVVGTLPISFFSDSGKIMRFYDFAGTSIALTLVHLLC